MKVLAHIREQYRLSLGSYGRPRMTMELKEVGLDVGERRVGRLMKINGVRRQNIWRNSRRRLAECRPRLGIDVRRRACGVASADVRWSVA